MTERFGFVLLPGSGLLPLAGAVDALLGANALLGRPAYEPLLLRVPGTARRAGDGTRFAAEATDLERAPPLDALLVVADGMPGERDPAVATVGTALHAVVARGGTIGGIGTGAAWLARAGLLRGHRCTLHWAHAAELAERCPDSIVSQHLYEIDRQRLSCAGGSASLDMMLAWLGQRHGANLLRQLLALFGLERLRARDERQHVPSAARLGGGSARLVEAVALMEANIAEPLSTEDVARLVGVSRRQLERLFRRHLDALPSRWYLELRLERARRLLQQTSRSILQVGLGCGFSSAPHFSNAYRNHFGRTPREERSALAAAWHAGERVSGPEPELEDPA